MANLHYKPTQREHTNMDTKIADLLNEVVQNASRLINKVQMDCDRLARELKDSYKVTKFLSGVSGRS